MELNKAKNVCFDVKFDEESFMEKSADVKRGSFSDFDDSVSDESCKDIADLLPDDPFGMGFEASLPRDPFGMDSDIEANFRGITGWIEDFGVKDYGFETDEASEDKNNDDNKIFAGPNFYWTNSYEQQEEGDNEIVDVYSDDFMCFGSEIYDNDADGGDPDDALFFALAYLGLKDLLSVDAGKASKSDKERL